VRDGARELGMSASSCARLVHGRCLIEVAAIDQ